MIVLLPFVAIPIALVGMILGSSLARSGEAERQWNWTPALFILLPSTLIGIGAVAMLVYLALALANLN